MCYTAVGTFITVGVGALVSYFSGGSDEVKRLDLNLLSPYVHRYIENKDFELKP